MSNGEQDRYRLIFEHALEAIFIAQDQVVKFFNRQTEVLTGYSQEEIPVTPFITVIHLDDRRLVYERHQKRLAGGQAPDVYSFRVVTKQGTIRWVELKVVPILWEGKPATLNFMADISDRKQAEEALRESEARYRHIFENAAEGIFQTTAEGRLVRANPAFAKMFGYGSSAEIEAAVTDIGTQLYADPATRRELIAKLLAEGSVKRFAAEAVRKNGERLWVSINCRVLRDERGNFTGVEGTNIEIPGPTPR